MTVPDEGEGLPVIDISDILFDTADLDTLVRALWGEGVSVVRRRTVGGGSINRTEEVELAPERLIFVKLNSRDHTGLFEEEARGLRALRVSGGPRVPAPLAIGRGERTQILIMEYIEAGRKNAAYYRQLGVSLLPPSTAGDAIGAADSTGTTISARHHSTTVGMTTGSDFSASSVSFFRRASRGTGDMMTAGWFGRLKR